MTAPVRWGLMATGGIARTFAADLPLVPGAELTAVGSRSRASADAFADEFGIAGRYGSYEELAQAPDVDVVYVSPPHPYHRDAALLAIENGKGVLVEKPFAMDAAQAREIADAARANGVFAMEAMWMRFLPHIARLRTILAEGTLGDVVYLTAEHGQWFELDASHRLFAPGLGGGALLDLGIYPMSFAHLVLGAPSTVTAVSTPAFTGVDGTTSAILQYPSGAHAVLTTSLSAKSGNPAVVYGREARVELGLDGWWYFPTSLRVISHDEELLETFETPPGGRGMEHEIAEVVRCVQAGLTESPLLPLAETVAIMDVLDEVRGQIGLDYAAL